MKRSLLFIIVLYLLVLASGAANAMVIAGFDETLERMRQVQEGLAVINKRVASIKRSDGRTPLYEGAGAESEEADTLALSREQIASLTKELQALQREHLQQLRQLEEARQAQSRKEKAAAKKITRLETKEQRLKHKQTTLQQNIPRLRQSIASSARKETELARKKSGLRTELRSLEGNLRTFRNNMQGLQSRKLQIDRRIKTYQLSPACRESRSIERFRLNGKDEKCTPPPRIKPPQEYRTLVANIGSLQKSIESTEKRVSVKKTALSNAERDLKRVRKSKSLASEQLEKSNNELGQAGAELVRVKREAQQSKAQHESLQAELQETEGEISRQEAVLGDILDLQKELEKLLADVEKSDTFSGSQYKLAVFTYDDPDQTGLGNAISYLVAQELLFSTRVGSFSVSNFQQGAAPKEGEQLAYYDKIEKLVKPRGYTVAVWGRLTRVDDKIKISTYVQIPDEVADRYFSKTLTVSSEGKHFQFQAGLYPRRFMLQSILIEEKTATALLNAVDAIRTLRQTPKPDGTVVGKLAIGSAFRLTGMKDDWRHLQLVDTGKSGWTSTRALCESCRELFASTAFINGLAEFAAYGGKPRWSEQLSQEARSVADQLQLLSALGESDASVIQEAKTLADAWTGEDAPPVGGAAFENFSVLLSLHTAGQDLQKESARDQAARLARAVQKDPGNSTVLQNLTSLFDYLGDTRRSAVARRLAEKYR